MTDRDTHLRRDRLDPRSRVDRIPGQKPLARGRGHAQPHERLPGVDPDPQPQRSATDAHEPLRLLDDPKPRTDCTLRVVLVRGRHSEHPDHRVADELLDHPAVRLDLRPHQRRSRRQHPVDVLRIGRPRTRP